MFVPEKMEQVHVVFIDKDVDAVTEALIRHGTIQMVDAASMDSWAQSLGKAGDGEEPEDLRQRRECLERLNKDLGLSIDLSDLVLLDLSIQDIDPWLEKHEPIVRAMQDMQTSKEKDLVRLKESKSRIDGFSQLPFPVHDRNSYTYLTVEAGRVADENLSVLENRLSEILHVLSPIESMGGKTSIVVVALKRDQDKVKQSLAESGFETLNLGEDKQSLTPELFIEIERRIKFVQAELEGVRQKREQMAKEYGSMLRSGLFHIRWEILKQRILKYFRKTERTYLLSGWIPSEHLESLVHEVNKATRNRCVIQGISADRLSSVRQGKLQVPVQMKNPFLFRPFELLTKTYGTPAYRTVDPTPILGISSLLMFGMMFGDVGHGLILGLLGGLMILKGAKSPLRNAGMLLLYAGCSSVAFGFLFGSLFGLETVLPTLWMKPMESISRLFTTAIFFGVGMITIAIVLNMVNGMRRGDILGMIFDKAGLLAMILYWCGILVATRFLAAKTGPGGGVPILIPVLLFGSLILLFLREPIIHLLQGKRKLFPEGLMSGIIGGLVEILEIVLGFLANTVSFIRVAAFGLAHAGLFLAIFALSDLVKTSGGGVVSALVLVFGNMLIIALEGLVVSIQTVRLEFYEFFSRFFEHGTESYRPLKSELGV